MKNKTTTSKTRDNMTRQFEPFQSAYNQNKMGINQEEPPVTGLQYIHQLPVEKVGTWGQQLDQKKPNTIQLLTQNIGRIDIHPQGLI